VTQSYRRDTLQAAGRRIADGLAHSLASRTRGSWTASSGSCGSTWNGGRVRVTYWIPSGRRIVAGARFEAGGTIPTLPVLGRIARALDADLVRVAPRTGVA
jgi:hypothetical protein